MKVVISNVAKMEILILPSIYEEPFLFLHFAMHLSQLKILPVIAWECQIDGIKSVNLIKIYDKAPPHCSSHANL
jgi:hypothetical protein